MEILITVAILLTLPCVVFYNNVRTIRRDLNIALGRTISVDHSQESWRDRALLYASMPLVGIAWLASAEIRETAIRKLIQKLLENPDNQITDKEQETILDLEAQILQKMV